MFIMNPIAYQCLFCFCNLLWDFDFQDKAPYVAKAEKRKSDYEKELKAYNKRQVITHYVM